MKKRVHIVALAMLICLSLCACSVKGAMRKAEKEVDNIMTEVLGEDEPEPEPEDQRLPEPIVVEGVSFDRYCYQQLDEEGRIVYDQVLDTILNHNEKVTLSTLDENVLKKAYNAMLSDYGNLFWISGYQYNTYKKGQEITGLEFLPKYTMDKEKRDQYQAIVDETVAQWLYDLPEDSGDYEKALYVFENLINRVDYVLGSENNQNILSVFVSGQTVCQGYANAAWYLLNELGIKNTIITGNANGEPHAWNLVYLDNAYYFMDVTWGNSKYMNQDNAAEKRVNYAYLAMTTEEISLTHTISMDIEIPECLSNACSYYVRNGLYFEDFDVGTIGRTMEASWDNGEEVCTMKFSNQDIYRETIDYFINEQHIVDFCWNISSISYIADDSCNVLTLQWMQ